MPSDTTRRQVDAQSLTLTAWDAAQLLGYNDRQFRRLVTDGHLPAPIDDTLHPKLWRWSRSRLEQYVNGRQVAA
jgi:predicted DNA-binding transcriptional regulator AlpA